MRVMSAPFTTFHHEELLALPGGSAPLRRDGDAFLGAGGERFEVDEGVVRILRDVDPLLARELEAQAKAVADYGDPHLLMPRYEIHVAELALVELFGGALPRGRVLDAGCGIGLLGRLYPGLDLVGLEASLPLLREARTGYALRVEGSAESLPFVDQSFDVVVALNMLHHVIHPDKALEEYRRVLRPGGMLVAVDPRKVWPIELAKRALRGRDETFADTHKAFTVREYRELVEGAGFRIEEYRRVGLVGLLGMGGLDALRLSRRLPDATRTVALLKGIDDALFRLPGVERAGLNLVVRATRS
jgi:SAM-dependent methyltransferase